MGSLTGLPSRLTFRLRGSMARRQRGRGRNNEQLLTVRDEDRSDDELLTLLREEYKVALLKGHRDRINNDIAPRFWARFANRFIAYKVLWDDPERDVHPDHEPRYLLDASYLGKVQADWMDRVLKGDIEPGDEVDEEPPEY